MTDQGSPAKAATSLPKDRRFGFAWVRTRRKAIILSLIAVVFAAVAALMLPHDPRVAAGTNIRAISIESRYEPLEVTTDMRRDAKTGGTIVLIEEFGSQSDVNDSNTESTLNQDFFATLDVPADTWGPNDACDKNRVDPTTVCTLALGRKDISARGIGGKLELHIPPSDGKGFGLATNAAFAAAALPPIEVEDDNFHFYPTAYNVGYSVPNESSYAWNGISEPAVHKLEGRSYTEWTQATGLFDRGSVQSGVSDARQDRDSLFTFIAGALLGVAGGALIGAVTEFL